MPSNDELKSAEVWGNALHAITLSGTTTAVVPEDLNEEEAEAWKARMETEDPVVEPFRGISEMTGMPGTAKSAEDPTTAWSLRASGDAQQYSKGEEGADSICVNVIRSLRWPGAVTVSRGGKFTSVYVGYGLKKGGSCFNPTTPPPVCSEPKDQTE